jgi:hypothetical protein
MGEMPPPHRLGVFEGEKITNHTLLPHQISQEHVVWAVSEHMTYGKHGLWPCLDGFLDLEAVVQTIRKRFLTHDVKTKGTKCSCNFYMLMIQHTDEDAVNPRRRHMTGSLVGSSLLLIAQKITPVCEVLADLRSRRLPDIPVTKLSSFEEYGVCYSCDDTEARVLQSSRI